MKRGVIILLTALAILLPTISANALSNSGGGSWQNYTDITINNPNGALTDYQVLVNLTGESFPVNANSSGADIRFTDAGSSELSYWIESWDYSGRNSRIWVKVPSIPSGGTTTIRMYFGNPSASSSSNGSATFDWFDDFSVNSSINYDIVGGVWNWDTANGYLSTTTTSGTLKLKGFTFSNHALQVDVKILTSANTWSANIFIRSDGTGSNGYNGRNDPATTSWPEYHLDKMTSGSRLTIASDPTVPGPNTWYTWVMKASGSSLSFKIGPFAELTATDTTFTSGSVLLEADIENTDIKYWDNMRIRKYTSPEPSVSLVATFTNSIGYSATVATGQNTFVQSSNGSFGLLLKGQTKTLNNSVILNNTGDLSAKVEARFNDSIAGIFGLISGANVLNATNFALGQPSALVPLDNSGADVQVAAAPPGVTAMDARLGVPSMQVAGDYQGTVILTFSNNV